MIRTMIFDLHDTPVHIEQLKAISYTAVVLHLGNPSGEERTR